MRHCFHDGLGFPLYNHTFEISVEKVYSENCYNWITVVLLYNSAILHCNEGLANHHHKMYARDLQRSLQFFEIASELLHVVEVSPSSFKLPTFDMVFLQAAIVNNMGRINLSLQCREEAKVCFQTLGVVFQHLQWMPELKDDEFLMFFMNTEIKVDSLRAAPAA
jgi:hypothetical protein